MTIRRTRAEKEHFEISVPVHAHAMAIVDREEENVHRTRRVERPGVDAFSVDLRLDKVEVIPVRTFGQLHPPR
jgi:hypothetical protein